MSMNFIEDTRIDPNNLHEEWIKQATLYAEWSERHVNAIRDRDLLKIKIDAYCARLGNKVRTNWMHMGFDKKPTEAAIEAYIGMDADYLDGQKQLADLNYNINLFQAARQGLEHKKRSIEGLERLHLAGYYSSLTTSPEGKDTQEQHLYGTMSAELGKNMINRANKE